jgi:uncharacterized membrane protein YkoI
MFSMKRLTLTTLIALAATAPAGAVERRGDQYEALEAREAGRVLSLRAIESRVIPQMGDADYLGPEFDHSSSVYRLKFMRGGRVIWVDVDARTGAVIGRSGR